MACPPARAGHAEAPRQASGAVSVSTTSWRSRSTTATVLTGTNLLGATAVTVDGKKVAFTAVSGTELRITMPKHAVGTANVQVTTPGGTSATGSASTFSWVA